MCGIIGYIGKKNGLKIVLEGLKQLEYRGYDSWGVAVFKNGLIFLHKKKGKIGRANLKTVKLPGSSPAIGHTRWATHGGVTVKNAHPHLSQSGRLCLVHNGIIENFTTLKKDLQKQDYKFKSQTDTEVIANLIDKYSQNKSLKNALRAAFKKIQGRNAIVLIDKKSGEIFAARSGSPLILGENKQGFFIASDIPAFVRYTSRVRYLDDGEMVEIAPNQVHFFDIQTGRQIKKRLINVGLKSSQAEKGRFPHFMLKEIMEQKRTIRGAIEQPDATIQKVAGAIKKAKGSFLIGAGTANKVCKLGEYFFAKIASRHINSIEASEFPSFASFLTPQSLMLVVSQSGETADSLEAIEKAKQKKAKVISIVNVLRSTIDRLSDYTLHIKAGPEKAVASTKATTAQMAVLALLAYASVDKLAQGKRYLIDLGSKVNDMLNPRYEAHIKKLAARLKKEPNIYIIGRDINYPIAKESAIKLQEVSYIHAEGFAGGELKHGPIALISQNTPLIVLVSPDTKEEILSNAQEVKARGGYIIGVAPENEEIFDYWIKVPKAGILSPIVNLIPVQILAYHLAVLRGCDPDQPRNLAKSVTVK